MTSIRPAGPLVAAAALLIGCGGGESEQPGAAASDASAGRGSSGSMVASVRDSAGVTLVSYTARPTIRVVREPVLAIGTVEGAVAEQLHRVTTPFRRPDGSVVVPNSGTGELRFFAADGSFIRGVGSQGDGPGEFRSLTWVRPYRGDSLAVWDERLGRITVLDGRGGVARTFRPRPAGGDGGEGVALGPRPRSSDPGGLMRAVDVLADGRFVARRGQVVVGPGAEVAAVRQALEGASRDTTSVRRDRFPYVLLDVEGRTTGELASLPDDEQFVWSEGGSRSVRPRAFGRTTSVVVAGERIHVAVNDGFGVRILDPAGRVRSVVRGAADAPAVTAADRSRWLESELDGLGDTFLRRVAETALRAMDFPERMPWHGDLSVGSDGRIWLEEYSPPHLDAPSTWTVMDPEGRREVVRVSFPSGFRLTWAGKNHALGVLRDELDVERVVIYELLGTALSSG